MMDLVIEDLLKDFQAANGLESLTREQAFETFATYCILDLHYDESDDEFEPDSARVGGPRDLGIDAVVVDINDRLCTRVEEVRKEIQKARKVRAKFVVIQARARSTFEADVVTKLAEALYQVFRPEPMTFAASKKVRELRECVEAVYASSLSERPKLSAYYVAGGQKPKGELTERCSEAVARLEQLDRLQSIRFQLIGKDELVELYRRASDAVSASVLMENRVLLPSVPGVRQAFVGVLRAKDVVDRLLTNPAGAIRAELFNENVRGFLGYGETDREDRGTSVNSQIRDSIRGEGQLRFPLLNNGLTIVARKLDVVGHEMRMRDFHIVNGCQTCYVLFDDVGKLDDNTYVQVKLIETADEELISEIVAGANRQNAIAPGDLVAREKLQREIEVHFRTRPNDRQLYYERRVGQYSNQPVEKTRIITRAQLTKAYAAMFLDEAHRATRLSELLASRGDQIFRAKDSHLPYYACASVLYRIEWLFRNGHLASTYRPAKFHFVAGFKLLVLGPDRLPDAVRAQKAECEKLADAAWDTGKARELSQMLVSALHRALDEQGPGTARLGEVVRTARFRRNMANAALALRGS